MKIGVLTPYDSANFGAFLQAYATRTFLEGEGNQVFFLRWRTEKERKKIFFRHGKGWKNTLRYWMEYTHRRKNYVCMTKAIEIFDIIPIEDIKRYGLDAVIIGSDEVWNINVKSFQKRCFYGLNYFEDVFCTAYAPSVGNADMKSFEKYPEQKSGLRDMDIVGVRDANTQQVIRGICGLSPQIVCDPTCLIEPDFFPERDKVINIPYLLVYSYSVSEQMRGYVKRYAAEKGLKTVSVCMRQNWCDMNLACTPMEFLALIKHSECVFTTTFHGSIFTLMYHKRCVIEAGSKKLQDLLSWTCMDRKAMCVQDGYDTFVQKMEEESDYSEYEKSIALKRQHSAALYRAKLEEIEHGKNL